MSVLFCELAGTVRYPVEIQEHAGNFLLHLKFLDELRWYRVSTKRPMEMEHWLLSIGFFDKKESGG